MLLFCLSNLPNSRDIRVDSLAGKRKSRETVLDQKLVNVTASGLSILLVGSFQRVRGDFSEQGKNRIAEYNEGAVHKNQP